MYAYIHICVYITYIIYMINTNGTVPMWQVPQQGSTVRSLLNASQGRSSAEMSPGAAMGFDGFDGFDPRDVHARTEFL